MSLCSHHCILRLYGYCLTEQSFHLILELGSMGSLWSVLNNKERFPSLPFSLSLVWMIDILSGLSYLHQQKIVHRDVKAENVIVCDGMICKLTDFGLSKHVIHTEGANSNTPFGTTPFLAPEARDKGHYSHRSDIYSFGVTCYQIISRSNLSSIPLSAQILIDYIRPENLRDYIQQCKEDDSSKRPSARESLGLIEDMKGSPGDPRTDRKHPDYQETQVLKASAGDKNFAQMVLFFPSLSASLSLTLCLSLSLSLSASLSISLSLSSLAHSLRHPLIAFDL
jgi:serine/threonine protein kinase